MLFIFEVTIKPGYTAEQYADAWVRASELIQQAPGAMGTKLHRNINDGNSLLAIARWDSKENRDAMEGSQPDKVREIIASQAPFVEIHVIGEFEEPEWVAGPC